MNIPNRANFDAENLELSQAQFKAILENSFDEIFVINNKGIVLYVNEACERHYGLKPSEVIGKTVHYLVAQGYYTPALAPIVFREKKRITLEQETRFGKKLVVTATPVLDEQGEIDFVVMNSRDKTQIELLKQDLEKTKKLVEQYKTEVDELKQKQTTFFEGFHFCSEKMKYCMEMAQRVAPVDTTVLITGQSGTGKNVLAKEIHKLSKRKVGPFISINCAAIPEQLLESELFGYRRGA
ncbi:MAG: sigma 54-interacting transcriptional regulator, partial [Bacillota bacterium]|nr:sigma 54-interacting transcriptional regulator [Bacillota bacterium]